jgi:hypothetical protein
MWSQSTNTSIPTFCGQGLTGWEVEEPQKKRITQKHFQQNMFCFTARSSEPVFPNGAKHRVSMRTVDGIPNGQIQLYKIFEYVMFRPEEKQEAVLIV